MIRKCSFIWIIQIFASRCQPLTNGQNRVGTQPFPAGPSGLLVKEYGAMSNGSQKRRETGARLSLLGGWLLIAGVVATVMGVWVGVRWGNRICLPFFQAAVVYPVFYSHLVSRRWGRGLGLVLVWTVAVTSGVFVACALAPARAQEAIYKAAPYTQEMIHWILTGDGDESRPGRFVPAQLLQLIQFMALCYISRGFLGLVMGAILLNYMNYYAWYVASISLDPLLAVLVVWPPWALLRVVGYVCIALGISGAPFLGWRARSRAGHRPGFLAVPLAVGVVLVGLDLATKAALAPIWQLLLHSALTAT